MDMPDPTTLSDYALLDLWYALEPTDGSPTPAVDALADEIDRRALEGGRPSIMCSSPVMTFVVKVLCSRKLGLGFASRGFEKIARQGESRQVHTVMRAYLHLHTGEMRFNCPVGHAETDRNFLGAAAL
jgi:hypothetical protein